MLDRAGDTEPRSVRLLDDVELFEVSFLATFEDVETNNDGRGLDTRSWRPNWGTEQYGAQTVGDLAPPIAVELTFELSDLGELRRLYALPPI